MRQSKLFGEKELILLEKRIDGDKKDPTGLWSRKVKPKVIEMVDEWMPRRKQLKKVVREIRASCENNTICEYRTVKSNYEAHLVEIDMVDFDNVAVSISNI